MKNTILAEMADDSEDVSKLSRQMQGRYAVQYPLYKQRTMALFKNLTTRGDDSYLGIEPRITAINKYAGKDKDYVRTIMSSTYRCNSKRYIRNEGYLQCPHEIWARTF